MSVNLFPLRLVNLMEDDGWELKFKLTFAAFCGSSVRPRCHHMDPVAQDLDLLMVHHLLIELNDLVMELLRV